MPRKPARIAVWAAMSSALVRYCDAGGILPIALAVPGGIALLALGFRVQRRRRDR